MRATKRIKMIMLDKDVKVADLAERTGKATSTIYNTFNNDKNTQRSGMTFETASELAEALGCELVFRDKETGKVY